MVELNFPDTPTPGQVFGNYTWNGTVWQLTSVGALGAVRYDAVQALMAAQQAQGRQNVVAAPFDAMAFNGMQINGSMEVSQENGATSLAFAAGSVGKYVIDGFWVGKSGTNAFTVQQVASVFPGYTKELKLTITTAQAAIGSDLIYLDHFIEGYRFSKMQWGLASAQPVSIGFWVKSSVRGSLVVQLTNPAAGTGGSQTVVIDTAGVAQWASFTLPGFTTGTWTNDNTIGARLRFFLAIGGAMNIADTVGNTFEITGLVIMPGGEAPNAARSPLIMRPYNQELLLCQRYWWAVPVSTFFGMGTCRASGAYWPGYPTPAPMRASPTAPSSGINTVAGDTITAVTGFSATLGAGSSLIFGTAGIVFGTSGQAVSLYGVSAPVTFDARL